MVTGARGMLGNAVTGVFSQDFQVAPLSRNDLDITDEKAVKRKILDIGPDIVINCAAYTSVDRAETDRDAAFRVNALGPKVLAESVKAVGARLVHISTDYVFDGNATEPYQEYFSRRPRSVYGKSKALGEDFVMEAIDDYLIVRTSWLYGPGGKNFVTTILELAGSMPELRVINDQVGTPTFTKDLAQAIYMLVTGGEAGIFHFANNGQCSWYEFARAILDLKGIQKEIKPVSTEEFPRPAPRPSYSVLDTTKFFLATGSRPRAWKEALREFLRALSAYFPSGML